MQRLTQLWFALSDLLAGPLLAFSLVGAIAFPFAGPAHARMAQQPMTMFTLVGTCALWLMDPLACPCPGRAGGGGRLLPTLVRARTLAARSAAVYRCRHLRDRLPAVADRGSRSGVAVP